MRFIGICKASYSGQRASPRAARSEFEWGERLVIRL